jgi:hypothetical protein
MAEPIHEETVFLQPKILQRAENRWIFGLPFVYTSATKHQPDNGCQGTDSSGLLEKSGGAAYLSHLIS